VDGDTEGEGEGAVAVEAKDICDGAVGKKKCAPLAALARGAGAAGADAPRGGGDGCGSGTAGEAATAAAALLLPLAAVRCVGDVKGGAPRSPGGARKGDCCPVCQEAGGLASRARAPARRLGVTLPPAKAGLAALELPCDMSIGSLWLARRMLARVPTRARLDPAAPVESSVVARCSGTGATGPPGRETPPRDGASPNCSCRLGL
jgi:hypothetical protein